MALTILRVAREAVEFGVFFRLHQSRLFSKNIDREWGHDCAQPTRERAATRVISELTGRLSVFADSEAVQLCPDRLRQIFRCVLVGTRRACCRTHCWFEALYKVVPCIFISVLAGENQAQIARLHLV